MRLFVAVEPPPADREGLWRAMASWRKHWGMVRWEPPAKLHLTLRFLGQTRELSSVCEAVRRAAVRHRPFALTLGRVGCYPSTRNPRVVWVGITEGVLELSAVQRTVEEELEAVGFAREGRPFSPHLTVGRVKGLLRHLPVEELAVPPIRFPVERLVVKESVLAPGGSLYTDRGSFPLGATAEEE